MASGQWPSSRWSCFTPSRPRCPGGFIGVDIFFVISGFLISGILLEQLASGRFSLGTFYAHRIRRIFPALILVLLSTFGLGWIFAMPDDMQRLGMHLATGAGFVQNFALLQESGYFDVASETKPLLHLWSLAIEEQFYLFYPPLLWLLWHWRQHLLAQLSALAAISFAASIWWIQQDPSEAFFLPFPRFWELLAGSILAIHRFKATGKPGLSPTVQNVMSIVAAAAILVSLALLDSQSAFPGWSATLPVLSAVGLILAGPQAWINRIVLSNKVAIWIGLISYPLYLWHWPLLAFLHITNQASEAHRAMAMCLSVALAWLTYQLIERPLRRQAPRARMLVPLVSLMVLIGYLGINTMQRSGLPFRFNNESAIGARAWPNKLPHMTPECGTLNPEEASSLAECWRDNRAPARFALMGDSKATSLSHGLLGASTESHPWTFLGGTNALGRGVPVLTDAPDWAGNQKTLNIILTALERQPQIKLVVIATATRALYLLPSEDSVAMLPEVSQRTEQEAEAGFLRVVNRLVSRGKKVAIVIDNPTLNDARRCMYRTFEPSSMSTKLVRLENPGCSISLDRHLQYTERYRAMLERIRNQHPDQVRLFDPTELMCDMAQRTCSQLKQGTPMYSYTDHISTQAAEQIAQAWMPSLIAFAEDEPADSQKDAQ